MISRFAAKRLDKLVSEESIGEELRLIEGSDGYYITPSAKVFRKHPTGWVPHSDYTNPRNGYKYITIQANGNRKTFRLHRLVARAYIENPNDYPVVGHKDNNKVNNSADNLYWTTVKENSQKAVDDGLSVNAKGYEDSQSHPVVVYDLEWNELFRFGSVTECAKALNVCKSTISRQCKGMRTAPPTGKYYYRYQNFV